MITKQGWTYGRYSVTGVAMATVLTLVIVTSDTPTGQSVTTQPTPLHTQEQISYTILKQSCPKSLDCLIFAHVDGILFECGAMTKLGTKLRNDFGEYSRVRVLLFDDLDVANQHIKGTRAPSDIDKDIRGVFEFQPAKSTQFIEFAHDPGLRYDQIRINL